MKKTYLSHNKKKNLADWPELSLERNEGERDLDLSQTDFFFFSFFFTLETLFCWYIFIISSQLCFWFCCFWFFFSKVNFNFKSFGLTGSICEKKNKKTCKPELCHSLKRVSLPAVWFLSAESLSVCMWKSVIRTPEEFYWQDAVMMRIWCLV